MKPTPAAPQPLIDDIEHNVSLPPGSTERFTGYGVMGLPFQSGHVLAMRRFVATSVGPAYTSVWHRNPAGDWVFYADTHPRRSCPRYFGATASSAIETDIRLTWTTPSRLSITMPDLSFEWDVEVRPTAATRLMNTVGGLLPRPAWLNPRVLTGMELMAGPLLGVGRVGLHGRVPNGQRFIANPRVLWAVANSSARLAERDFGSMGPVTPQAQLGDFWIPQRGMFAIGDAYFDSFDPALHSEATSRTV
jgi:hypothetical protein